MTTAQMNAIAAPLNGAVVYNTNANSLFVYSNGSWKNNSNPTLVMNKAGGTMQTVDNMYYNFLVGPSDVQLTDNVSYTVTGNGTITINRTGVYTISASFSTSNLPVGNHKYIIGAFKNGTLIGYLTRGFVSVPTSPSDYFGTSGVLTYLFNANDVLELRYVLNNGGNAVNALFFNIGLTKIN